ncbi:MAG: Fe-S oxidoreductase, partial [Actinomycetaceae bacterium UMB1218B]|nr:Fe-S oxidoreductase [Actinomycetaceae bacterium UMB1218B]
MASSALSVVCWVFSLLVTLLALLAFGRGIAHIWRQVSQGQPDPGRLRPVGKRLWSMISTILTHREFKHRPWVKVAHWLVMISFPLLFLTLVAGYGQLRDQMYALPLLGHFAPWEWLTEILAWGGLLGIIYLMTVRKHAGHGSVAEAAVSNDDQASLTGDDAPLSRPHPRDGSPQGLASRFLGSTKWQALFVEWVVLIVCVCIIGLRGLEYGLMFEHNVGQEWPLPLIVHFPLTGWIGALAVRAGLGSTGLANAIAVVATVKIMTSMLWMMVVGVQTSMGVAWHRFIAIVNLYARRNVDGTKSLGPA